MFKRNWGGAGAGTAGELAVGMRYMREEIPPLLGLEYSDNWRQGFLSLKVGLLLLVTLDKTGKQEEYHYQDRFLSPSEFHWQSQNRTTQKGKHGQQIRGHKTLGLLVHLFVRKRAKRGQKAAPFVYCGELEFERWEGEKPITVWWRLTTPLTEVLWGEFSEQ